MENYKTVEWIFLCEMCCLKQLFKYAFLATHINVFWEFQTIRNLLYTLLTTLYQIIQ